VGQSGGDTCAKPNDSLKLKCTFNAHSVYLAAGLLKLFERTQLSSPYFKLACLSCLKGLSLAVKGLSLADLAYGAKVFLSWLA